MPLFSRSEPEPAPAPIVEERPKRHGLFGSKRETSPTPSRATTTTTSSSNSSVDRTSSRRSGLLSKFGGHGSAEMDPSIMQARERVMAAEAAERDADRALMAARESARQAREQVKILELEAQEEARRAQIKQYHAREVSKRGKQLGRKSPPYCSHHGLLLVHTCSHTCSTGHGI